MDQAVPAQASGKTQDVIKAELERVSNDLYKVYNPTKEDYKVVWNARILPKIWVIPAQDEAIVPNYIRIKYIEEMTDKIVISKSDKMIIEENEKRATKGFNNMDLHTEQFRFESRNLKILQSKREQIRNILDRGLYQEYGIVRGIANAEGNKRDLEAGSVLDNLDKAGESPKAGAVLPQEAGNTKNGTNEHTCDECGKIVSSPLALSGHKRSHQSKEPAKTNDVAEVEDE